MHMFFFWFIVFCVPNQGIRNNPCRWDKTSVKIVIICVNVVIYSFFLKYLSFFLTWKDQVKLDSFGGEKIRFSHNSGEAMSIYETDV